MPPNEGEQMRGSNLLMRVTQENGLFIKMYVIDKKLYCEAIILCYN